MTPATIGLWAAFAVAQAKESRVHVNGERADSLRDVVLEDVDVRFDEKGNIWIEAPQYQVGGTAGSGAREPVATGVWWLVVQDSQSADLQITLTINGRVVTVIKSGQGGGTLDLAPWLHRGANQVVLSSAATEAVQGGALQVKIGEGLVGNKLGSPVISFARDPAAATEALERSFVLRVP
jgi:hypothetical protein